MVPIEDTDDDSFDMISQAIIEARKRLTNGASVRIWQINPSNAEELNSHIGKIIRWSNGKGQEPYKKPKQKGWIGKIVDGVGSLLNEEIEF